MNARQSLVLMSHTRWGAFAVAAALLQACGPPAKDRKGPTSDSLSSVTRTMPANPDLTPDTLRAMGGTERGHVAAHAISWDAPTVAGHLRGIGLTARAVGVVARPMFRVRGQRFDVNGGRAIVEAYFYGDANAVALDTDKLDTVQVMPSGGSMRWEKAARLIVDNNMAAVVLADDAALRNTIDAALRSDLHGSAKQQ